MGQPDLNEIINEIKSRGLTAYEISKELPLSEAGINKILNGNSNPRKSTLLLLENYLFGGEKEKTPTSKESRFEDVIAKQVAEELKPFIQEKTDDLLQVIMNMQIELSKIRNQQAKTLEKQNETFELISEKRK